MKVTPPITLLLNASRVTSNASSSYDPAEWLDASSYVEGNTVSRASTNKIYQCIADANNTIAAPETDILSDTPHWAEVSYINKWKMFDYTNSGSTSANTSLAVTITPQVRASSLVLLGLTGCTSIVISASNGGAVSLANCVPTALGTGISVTKSTNLTVTGTGTGITDLIIYDLPAITTIVYTITITGPGELTCKSLLIGWSEYLGSLQDDITRGHINFSKIDRDTYGTVTFVRRRSVPKLNFSLHTLATDINRVIAVRDQLNAITAFWNAMDDNAVPDYTNSLFILGFYRNFSIRLDNPLATTVSMEIEEI